MGPFYQLILNASLALLQKILTGGTAPTLFHWTLNGEKEAEIPVSPTAIYSLAVNKNSKSNKVIYRIFLHPSCFLFVSPSCAFYCYLDLFDSFHIGNSVARSRRALVMVVQLT